MESMNPVRNAIAINNKLADTFSVMLFSPNCDIFFHKQSYRCIVKRMLRECYGIVKSDRSLVNCQWSLAKSERRKVTEFLTPSSCGR